VKYICIPVGPIGTNCYVFWDERSGSAAVVDPGFEPERIMEEIKANALKVEHIVLTHGHYDHILAVSDIKKMTGADVLIGKKDAFCLTDADRALAGRWSGFDFIPVKPDRELSEGDTFTVGELQCRVMETPGHTCGSICIICEDVIFSGDTLFYCECGRCDLPTGNYGDMLRSLARLARLEGNYTVLPGHDQDTTLDIERRHNRYMKEGLALR